MKKLAVIAPYNEKLIENFTDHFSAVVKQEGFYYKIFFIKQKSNRPLNKGKLFNIGFSLVKDKFDYFCFHDVDFIPISNFDYTPSEQPICLYEKVLPVEFGQHDSIEDTSDFDVITDSHFGGAVLFDKNQFQTINGYSNDYWGLGYEDRDLLVRMITKGYRLRSIVDRPIRKSYIEFNGMTSYGEIKITNNRMAKTTTHSFSLSLWFKIKKFPPHGDSVDNNRCEYFLLGRPGYHGGLSITHEGRIKGALWDEDKEKAFLVQSKPVTLDKWIHCGLSVDMEEGKMRLYVDGQVVSFSDLPMRLFDYHSKSYYVGVGNPKGNSWRNFTNGSIAEVSIWDYNLSEDEFSKVFTDGVTNREGKFLTTNIPNAYYSFDCGYDNIIFDMSGNNNHLECHNVITGKKLIKSSNERYLPYRRNGYFGYIGDIENLQNLKYLEDSSKPEVISNRNIFNKKLSDFDDNMKKDGLSMTKFRIVNRENFKDKHEIIQVVI